MKTIKEFTTKHNACREGREWALTHCKDMNEVWQTAKPEWLMWVATRIGVLTDVELRRFAVWSARQVQHLMTDERSLNALDIAERYANGSATDEELAAARVTALDAAHAAARAAARAAADAAADFDSLAARAAHAAARAAHAAARAARAAARAAHVAAYVAADAAAHAAADVARAAARAAADFDSLAARAAHAAAESAQAQWLRDNTNPNFA